MCMHIFTYILYVYTYILHIYSHTHKYTSHFAFRNNIFIYNIYDIYYKRGTSKIDIFIPHKCIAQPFIMPMVIIVYIYIRKYYIRIETKLWATHNYAKHSVMALNIYLRFNVLEGYIYVRRYICTDLYCVLQYQTFSEDSEEAQLVRIKIT